MGILPPLTTPALKIYIIMRPPKLLISGHLAISQNISPSKGMPPVTDQIHTPTPNSHIADFKHLPFIMKATIVASVIAAIGLSLYWFIWTARYISTENAYV